MWTESTADVLFIQHFLLPLEASLLSCTSFNAIAKTVSVDRKKKSERLARQSLWVLLAWEIEQHCVGGALNTECQEVPEERDDNVQPVWFLSARLFWTKLWIVIVQLSMKLVWRTKFPSSIVESFNWDNTSFSLSCCWLASHLVLELVMTIHNFHRCGTKETHSWQCLTSYAGASRLE